VVINDYKDVKVSMLKVCAVTAMSANIQTNSFQ